MEPQVGIIMGSDSDFDVMGAAAEALREFATGRLAHYKIPRYVHVVDEFPMTVTGKVRKVQMREQAGAILADAAGDRPQ